MLVILLLMSSAIILSFLLSSLDPSSSPMVENLDHDFTEIASVPLLFLLFLAVVFVDC